MSFSTFSTLNRLQSLVQIWSFECLQVFEEMSRKNSFEIDDEEEDCGSEKIYIFILKLFKLFIPLFSF